MVMGIKHFGWSNPILAHLYHNIKVFKIQKNDSESSPEDNKLAIMENDCIVCLAFYAVQDLLINRYLFWNKNMIEYYLRMPPILPNFEI